MNIAIIGAGFTGLSAAYELTARGHSVTIYESDDKPGGLAVGFHNKAWEWSVENHYHHWFTNDKFILNLARQLKYEVFIKRPKTSIYRHGKVFQMDSISNVLAFPLLNIINRLRMGLTLGFLRLNPFWKPLEKFRVSDMLPCLMGKKAYEILWKPLLFGKFGKEMDEVSLAWFWARIVKRTPSLAYPSGGFLAFAKSLQKNIEGNGGIFNYSSRVTRLEKVSLGKIHIIVQTDKKELQRFEYEKVLVTLSSFSLLKLAHFPETYVRKLNSLRGLGAINLVLRLKHQFLNDGTYWLNICEENAPMLAIVEHTNFIDPKYFNGEHLVYLGNYLPHDHPYMYMTKDELLNTYDPFLKKINPTYRQNLIGFERFTTPFAQPIIPIHYSRMIPPFKTPIDGVFLANMQQVYPWDRGTNYAVELGKKVAGVIENTV